MHLEIHNNTPSAIKPSFKNYISTSISEKVSEFLRDVAQDELVANVNFSHGHNSSKCQVTIHGGHHIMLRSDAVDLSPSSAFDLALTKLTTKLRKYKNQKFKKHEAVFSAKKTVYKEIDMQDDSYIELDESDVLESKDAPVEIMTSIEAVMKMDLAGLGGLSYIDQNKKTLCFVYRKHDGNIVFIDSDKAF